MAGEADTADRERCWVEDCSGARFGGSPECFAHLGDKARTEALSRLQPSADIDLRHTELTEALLHQLLAAVDRQFGTVTFEGARFPSGANFSYVTFDRVSFQAARLGDADFRAAVFEQSSIFDDTVFAARTRRDPSRSASGRMRFHSGPSASGVKALVRPSSSWRPWTCWGSTSPWGPAR